MYMYLYCYTIEQIASQNFASPEENSNFRSERFSPSVFSDSDLPAVRALALCHHQMPRASIIALRASRTLAGSQDKRIGAAHCFALEAPGHPIESADYFLMCTKLRHKIHCGRGNLIDRPGGVVGA